MVLTLAVDLKVQTKIKNYTLYTPFRNDVCFVCYYTKYIFFIQLSMQHLSPCYIVSIASGLAKTMEKFPSFNCSMLSFSSDNEQADIPCALNSVRCDDINAVNGQITINIGSDG